MDNFLGKLKEKIASMTQEELDESWNKVEDKSEDKIYFEDLLKPKFNINGYKHDKQQEQKCLYEGLDKSKVHNLYCTCKKCSFKC